MQIHDIQRQHPRKTVKRVGRGGKRGTYSGKGIKGQKVHGGRAPRPELRDIIKKIPKMRGRGKNIFTSIQQDAVVVNVGALNEAFAKGAVITPKVLVEKKLIRLPKGASRVVKVLGNGSLDKALVIEGCTVSASAREKIEKAGGSVK